MNSSLISIIEGTYSGSGINGITTIPSGFFAGCTITSNSYLYNITNIHDYAFLSASLPAYAFESVSNTINIGPYAFASCRGLQNFFSLIDGFGASQPIKINQFSPSAFRNCYNLNEVYVECSSIPSEAFYSCSSLSFVRISGYCSYIGSSAFYSCSRLVSVTINNPYSLSAISSYAFASCTSLQQITTCSFVSTLGTSAFYNCKSLSSISFDSVQTIPSSCFGRCSNLSIVSFQKCTTIYGYAFYYCTSLKTLSFPLCETISTYAFAYCSELANIASTIFSKCTQVGQYAFAQCQSLTYVSMYSVSSIGYYAFQSCSSITTMRVSQCLYIGGYAFEGCSKLSSIYINTNVSSQICTLANSNAFLGTLITSTTGRIVVPNALRASYKAAPNWAYFSARIYSS